MVGGTALSMDYIVPTVSKSDVLFVATSAPHTIVHPETIESAGKRQKPLLIVDVSVPKNVDDSVNDVPMVSLETMDGLQGVAAENIMKRKTEISKAELIVNEEIKRMDAEHIGERADKIIGEISRKAAAIREEEVSRAKSRAGAANIEEIFEDLSRAILSKMLADTYERIRSSSINGENNMIDAAKDLFKLEMK
jgi:glutamyl-tRNA reductase